jgi:amidase
VTDFDVLDLDATAQADLVRRGELTATELVARAIERIEQLNPAINAVVTTDFDAALDTARASPAPAAPFAGVPFLLKDLVAEAAGVRFTEGSRFLRDNISTFDQEIVARLRRAGFVILGKTNTPEFGLAPHCEPALFGPTRNPWNLEHSTSGSSGGSGAAVASRMVAAAHANDLGGSIRFPASCCGLFGLKPTRGRVPFGPEYGDPIGGMAIEHAVTRSVRDSAAILDAIAGPELGEPFPAPPAAQPFGREVAAPPGRLRIAYSAVAADGHETHPDCVAALDDAVALCAQLGHEVSERWLPPITDRTGAAIGTSFMAAASWILGYWVRKLGREPGSDEIEGYTRFLCEHGAHVTAAAYLLALEDLRRYSREIGRFFTDFDAWLTPTLAQPPPRLGEMIGTASDPLAGMGTANAFVAFPAIVANITGNPAMSVPLSVNAAGLPIGVHFLGRYGDEATLLRLASQLEAARPFPSLDVGALANAVT